MTTHQQDPNLVVEFVDSVSQYRDLIQRSFQFPEGSTNSQQYMLVRYEDLMGPGAENAVQGLQLFLGVEQDASVLIDKNERSNRQFESSPCYKKWTNWEEIKRAGGTREAFRACGSGRLT
jgi:Uma2 family endonuclease